MLPRLDTLRMNPWLDFLITVAIRLVCGAALGIGAFFLIAFRRLMNELARDQFPLGWLALWALIGGVLCTLTTPRDSLPWMH